MTEKSKFVLEKVDNIVGKGKKCFLLAFPHNVSKRPFSQRHQKLSSFGKGLTLYQTIEF